MEKLIHKISRLPCEGRDPTKMIGISGYLAMTKALKKKYKLEKKKRGYVIDSIPYKEVYIATQLLVGKVMRKCQGNKVPAIVIALAEQCAEGECFNWA